MATPRGKQFGKQLSRLAAQQHQLQKLDDPGAGTGEHEPKDTNREQENNKSSKKNERQIQFFDDLDQAENLALEVLSLASFTCKSLSTLTTTIGSRDNMDKGENDDSSTSMEDSDDSVNNMKDGDEKENSNKNKNKNMSILQKKLQKNGQEYLEKVAKIHSLLLPYSDLVVPYMNHDVDIKDKNIGKNAKTNTKSANVSDSQQFSASSNNSNDNSDNIGDNGNLANVNAYAARVELRLAQERKQVLMESLELEQKLLSQQQQQLPNSNTTSDTNKRRRIL